MYRKIFAFSIIFVLILGLSASNALAQDGQPPEQPAGPQSPDALILGDQPWTFTTIQSLTSQDLGKYAGLAFDPNNNLPSISYYNATNQDLMLANPITSGGNCGPYNRWNCQKVDTTGDVGSYSSIDIYRGNFNYKVGISYYDTTNKALKYAQYSCLLINCSWNISTIQSPGSLAVNTYGRYSSMKFDSNGIAHIAYYGNNFLTATGWLAYAHQVDSGGNCGVGDANGKWQCDVVDGKSINPNSVYVGTYASLDLNGSDEARIAYYDSQNKTLKYAWAGASSGNCGPSGTWQCDVIDDSADVGIGASLHISKGASDNPLIAYYDKTNGNLRYASIPSSGANCGPDLIFPGVKFWRCVTIDAVGTNLVSPPGISIAASDDGTNVHIAYQDASDDLAPTTLKVASPGFLGNCGPTSGPPLNLHTWQCTTVDNASYGSGYLNEADFVSVAVNQAGLAAAAYFEEDTYYNEGHLKFAYQYAPVYLPLVQKH
jgi:hypothetical protein